MRRLIGCSIGALLLGVVLVGTIAAPALAQERDRDHRDSAVSITGDITVGPTQLVDGPVATVDGSVFIAGRVEGDVYVVHGDVLIDRQALVDGTVVVIDGDVNVLGRVDGDVTAINGRARVAGGTVDGNVRSSERPILSGRAQVTGDVDKTDFSGWFTAIGFAVLAYIWIAVTVSLLVVGIVLFAVFPRGGDAIVRTAHDAVGASCAWGAIIAFGLPIAASIAIATFVGLPLGLGALIAMGLLFCLGYVVSAAALGRALMKEKSGLVAFLAGFGILRVVALIPGLGVLVWILASAYGVGVLAVAAYRAGRRTSEPPSDASTRDVPTIDAPASEPATAPPGTSTAPTAPPGGPPAAE